MRMGDPVGRAGYVYGVCLQMGYRPGEIYVGEQVAQVLAAVHDGGLMDSLWGLPLYVDSSLGPDRVLVGDPDSREAVCL